MGSCGKHLRSGRAAWAWTVVSSSPATERILPALIAGMDVFVLPSLNEGMGRVLVMAMALGKPIVAASVGGVPELLAKGEAGILVPPADPRALADAICTLLADPVRAKTLGAAGRRRAPAYGADAMVRALARLYREVLTAKV